MTRSGRSSYSLREIAERFGGEVAGDQSVKVSRVATLEAAAPGDIAFFANERYLPQLRSTRAAAVIVGEPARAATQLPRIVCANPYAYFAHVSALFNPERAPQPGVHPAAVVDPAAVIAGDAEVGPCAVIGRAARIGAGCVIGCDLEIGRFAIDEQHQQVLAIAALDNLVKGGAGNALQCLNVRFGLPERTGLDFIGLHPV